MAEALTIEAPEDRCSQLPCPGCGCNIEELPGANAGSHLGEANVLGVLLEVSSDWVVLVNREGVIVDFRSPNGQVSDMVRGPIIGRNFREVLPGEASKQAAYHLEKAFHKGQVQRFHFSLHEDARQTDFRAQLAQIDDRPEAIAVVRDVTSERLREKEILEITTREQTRIGQDLHDGLGQQLTGISFLSRALEQKLAANGLPEAADAAEICRLVIQTLSQTRNLARGLFPVEVEGNGLVSALKQLGLEVEKLFGISCAVDCRDDLSISDRPAATHLFRLAQEAINNSVKHGKAKQVWLRLERLNGSAVLSISDDGIGFRGNTTASNGIGLRIMNYRAQKVGGALDVYSKPSGGVHIRCTFPHPAPVFSQPYGVPALAGSPQHQ